MRLFINLLLFGWLFLGSHPAFTQTGVPQSDLLAQYGNDLARAVRTTGTARQVWNVSADITVSEDLTIPSNITLNWTGGGQISVASGKTLIINSMAPPGNRKLFTGAGNVRLGPQISQINLSWWAGNDTSIDATGAINAALASLTYSAGGVLNVPCGTWKTTGSHVLSNMVTIQGCGDNLDVGSATIFKLTNTGASFVFKASEAFRSIKINDFAIDLGKATAANGIVLEGNMGNGGVGFAGENLSINAAAAGSATIPIYVRALDRSNGWDVQAVSFTKIKIIPAINGVGIKIHTHNGSFRFVEPYFYMPNGSTGFQLLASADLKISQPSFLGATTPPPPPISTVNRTAAANIATGTAVLTLSGGANFTENDLGQKVTISGKLDSYIKQILTSTTATVGNPATGTSTGDAITFYRVAPGTGQAFACVWNQGDYGSIEIENSQDEGLQYFFINDWTAPNIGIILFRNSYIQSRIKNNADAIYTSMGNHYGSLTYVDSKTAQTGVYSFGDRVEHNTLFYGQPLTEARLQGEILGAFALWSPFFSNPQTGYQQHQIPQRYWMNYSSFSASPAAKEPQFSIGMADQFLNGGKPWLELASLNPNSNTRSLTYRFARNPDTGYMTVSGDQTGYVGYDFNGPIYTSVGAIRSGAVALTDDATITANPKAGASFYVTLGGNRTLALNPLTPDEQTREDGAVIQFEIKQDARGSRTLSLSTGSPGQFAFGSDIPSIFLTTTGNKVDIITAKYSKRLDRWMVIDVKKGY
jgi:hypothetical protein